MEQIVHEKLPDPGDLLEPPSICNIPIAPPMIFTDDFFQIECKVCTYLN